MSAISNTQRKKAQRKASISAIPATIDAKPSSNWAALKGKVAAKNPQYLKKRKRAASPVSASDTPEDESIVEPAAKLARTEYKSSFMDVLDPPEAGPSSHADAGKYVAIDCEFVGVGTNGVASSLARVSMVNFHGHVMLDTFVRQKERVTDYRTWVSGVRAEDLRGAPTFEEVVKMVADLSQGRILVGHAIYNDLQVLLLSHPRASIRDTQTYPGIHAAAKSKRPGLRTLAKLVLNIDIQAGEHSSVEDARATMAIYRAFKTEWDASLNDKSQSRQKATPKPTVVTKASSIDPTRRYKQNRSLGLAAVVSSQLVDDVDADQIQAVQSEGSSVAVPIVVKPFEGEEKADDAPEAKERKARKAPEITARSVSAPTSKIVASKAPTHRSVSTSKSDKPIPKAASMSTVAHASKQAVTVAEAQVTKPSVPSPKKSEKPPTKHVPVIPTAASTISKTSKKKAKAAASAPSAKSGNQGNWWEEGGF